MKKNRTLILSLLGYFFTLAFMTGYIVLFVLNKDTFLPAGAFGIPAGPRNTLLITISTFSYAVLYPLIAGFFSILIIARQPVHPIGWLLIITSLITTAANFTSEWAVYGYYTSPGSLPGVLYFAWLSNFAPFIALSLIWLTIAVFPDGRFVSKFWKTAFLIAVGMFCGVGLMGTNLEASLNNVYGIPSPFINQTIEPLHSFLSSIWFPIQGVIYLILIGSAINRFYKAVGVVRQQLKWMFYSITLMGLLTIIGILIFQLTGSIAGQQLVSLTGVLPALGIGISITRYRLYDIDLIIRRTLQYSLLTGLLSLVYFSGVALLQAGLDAIGGESSPVVIVLTTLLVAAIFNPLRLRIQTFIDRRFYRQKYDAEKALAEFAEVARSETDLEQLSEYLTGTVQEALQPLHVSLWLNPYTTATGPVGEADL